MSEVKVSKLAGYAALEDENGDEQVFVSKVAVYAVIDESTASPEEVVDDTGSETSNVWWWDEIVRVTS